MLLLAFSISLPDVNLGAYLLPQFIIPGRHLFLFFQKRVYLWFSRRLYTKAPPGRYRGLYINAHRSKMLKAQPDKHPFSLIKEEIARFLRRGRGEMIRKSSLVASMITA